VQLHFADCVLDCDRYEFVRAGERIDLQPKVWAFLRLLAENAHRVLPKEEILERLWPDVSVAEGSLQRLASLARAALGNDELLRTLRGVGYQLAAPVHVSGAERAAPEDGADPAPVRMAVRLVPSSRASIAPVAGSSTSTPPRIAESP
jgi:DNA-binding winged helix-turn-helix (wHTH) protein